MEIEIKNFGPIDHIKFDLDKDLHLIYGQNAIGKSYATYCLYCLLKNVLRQESGDVFDVKVNEQLNESIKTKVEKLSIDNSVDVSEEYTKLLENKLKIVLLDDLNNSFRNTFISLFNLKNQYSNIGFEISISILYFGRIIIFANNDGKLDLVFSSDLKAEIAKRHTESGTIHFRLNSEKGFSKSSEALFYYTLNSDVQVDTNRILDSLNFNIRDIYYLPASRSGLYQGLNAFTPIIAELTQNRFFMQNKNIELPSLSEPVADYFIDLSTVNKNHVNKEFEEIIGILQNDILKGEVEYDDQTKKIVYKPTGINLNLNLSEASSMVSELSPLVLYLRHILNNKHGYKKSSNGFAWDKKQDKEKRYDILFIEEPEAHLHPEVQVKLMEVFAKLSELGLKVFITSHSNYMFNKLNNLLIKKEVNIDKVAVYHLIQTPLGSAVNTGMTVSEDGIEDDNFQQTSEKLYYERLDYLEKNDTGN